MRQVLSSVAASEIVASSHRDAIPHGSDDRAITGASMRQLSDWDGVDISFAPRDDESRDQPMKEKKPKA